jgi:BCD family chlorophyll transporter-like MFS transporter
MWGGTLIQFLGLAVMPFALLVLSGQGQVPVPAWVGQGAAALAFLMVGAGLQTSQTAGLALATDQASPETRPRVVALMYVMLLVGAVGGSSIFSMLLADFSPQRLIQVVQGTALVVLLLNGVALWKQEPRNPQRVAALKHQKQPAFSVVWQQFIQAPSARRFLWVTALGTMAFNMQDIVLEPCGLLGFMLAGHQLARGMDPLRLAAYGALVGLPAFSAVIFSAPLDAGWLFRAGALGIGFGGGLFAVGTLFAAMRMEGGGFIGMALGAWGAVQSLAAGLAMFLGGALRDIVTQATAGGAFGEGMAAPFTGYSVVYHVEMLLLFITLIAIGPLVQKSTRPPTAPKLGLANSTP